MHLLLVISATIIGLISLSHCTLVYQHPQEWRLWKSEHRKSYTSTSEELERHLIWLSNRKYIEGHNANADVFGYSLSMNRFGDMVRAE